MKVMAACTTSTQSSKLSFRAYRLLPAAAMTFRSDHSRYIPRAGKVAKDLTDADQITTNIDIPKKEFCVTLSVVGISLGKFCGSFDNGFSIDVNIFVAKGSVRFYVKNGNQLWVRVDLDVTFDGGYHQDAKIIDF